MKKRGRFKKVVRAIFTGMRVGKIKKVFAFERFWKLATLLEKYDNSLDPEFKAKVLMAMVKRAGVELAALTGSETYYERYTTLARLIWEMESSDDNTTFAKVLAAGNFSNASTDQEISTAVTDNWDTISRAFGPF